MPEYRKDAFYPKALLILLKDALWAWDEDKAWRLGAALAYFTLFSLAPLLIIVLTVTSAIFGEQAIRGQIFSEIQFLIGKRGAQAVQGLLENAYLSEDGLYATIFSVVMLIFGSTAVFVQLRHAINTIWHIAEKPINTLREFIRARIVAFTLILLIGFLLLVSFTVSALLGLSSDFLAEQFPILIPILNTLDFFVSFGFITVLVALIFKVLPDAQIKWKDVWVGSAMISFLFTIGKMAIGFYLGRSGIASTFGAASSLALVLLWTFYSAQIFLFGAEFMKLFADRFGDKILPDKHGVQIKIETVEVKPGENGTKKAETREAVKVENDGSFSRP